MFNALNGKIRGKSKLSREKTILVFSPHPDDDVISMGGILRKLWENDNEIVVAYMTSGNIAVFDHDVRRHMDFVERAAEWVAECVRTAVRERGACSLALAGVVPFSGFFSKDGILSGAWNHNQLLFWIGLGAAVLTAFYMMRLHVMTFWGAPKDEHIHDHAHESPLSMTLPLLALAALSAVGAGRSQLAQPTGDQAARPTGGDNKERHQRSSCCRGHAPKARLPRRLIGSQ